MKSPVPFIKPKSYYTSPIKPSVIRDVVVPQFDPISHPDSIPQYASQDIIEVEPQENIVEETPKSKKSKLSLANSES